MRYIIKKCKYISSIGAHRVSLVAKCYKESACNAGDIGSIPGYAISPGGRNGYPFQYSCLGNPMDREA